MKPHQEGVKGEKDCEHAQAKEAAIEMKARASLGAFKEEQEGWIDV